MGKRLLLFGATGKMGTAVTEALSTRYVITRLNSNDVDIADLEAVSAWIEKAAPDVVANAAAFLGIDPCENDPSRAFRMNALFPRRLAQLSDEQGFTLVHFSTDAVFSGALGRPLSEEDEPDPVNQYGASKYAGDVLIRDATERHYTFRLPVLFGESAKRNQLLEKLIDKVKGGERHLRIADDVVGNPSYSLDIARTVARALEENWDFGLYHVCNEGPASLFDLVSETMVRLKLDVTVERAKLADFPSRGAKNTVTPMTSAKVPPLRSWHEAMAEYLERVG